MPINTTGRDQRIVDAANQIASNPKSTGKTKAIGAVTDAFANGLLRNMNDSAELLTVLNLFAQIQELILRGALDPHPIPDTAPVQSRISNGSGKNTTVTAR